MYPATFDIRLCKTNKSVDFNELDKLICERFELCFGNKNHFGEEDYGHFLFHEGEMHQKSISWVGLIHTIVYYSDIDYGERRKSELLGALAYTIMHCIHFPMRMIEVLSRLLDYIYDDLQMVVYVTVRPDKYDPIYLYKNIYTHKKILKNETGLFECDDNGKLLEYYPSPSVLIDKATIRERYTYGDSYYKPCVHELIVPEGVVSFKDGFFRGGLIEGTLSFPSTVQTIGTDFDCCVFANTKIGKVILPDSMESFGDFAFGNAQIDELVYPNKLIDTTYRRQFKEATINTMLLPISIYTLKENMKSRNFEELFNPYDCRIRNIQIY